MSALLAPEDELLLPVSANGGGGYTPPPTASELVAKMLDEGYAVKVQANVKAGHITYEFIGGTYDGVKIRLYPPFSSRLVLGDDVYIWSPPKNGRSKRLTYRLEE